MPSKWADYLITAVRYSQAGTHIDTVQVRADNGDRAGAATTASRTQIVSWIEAGWSVLHRHAHARRPAQRSARQNHRDRRRTVHPHDPGQGQGRQPRRAARVLARAPAQRRDNHRPATPHRDRAPDKRLPHDTAGAYLQLRLSSRPSWHAKRPTTWRQRCAMTPRTHASKQSRSASTTANTTAPPGRSCDPTSWPYSKAATPSAPAHATDAAPGRRGAEIKVVLIDGERFIRSGGDAIAADEVEGVPGF